MCLADQNTHAREPAHCSIQTDLFGKSDTPFQMALRICSSVLGVCVYLVVAISLDGGRNGGGGG